MKLPLFLVLALLFSCNASKNPVAETGAKQKSNDVLQSKNDSNNNAVDYFRGPATIIYKTRNDYYDKVPVTLNDDKTNIVSYPAPIDVYYNGQLAYPTRLDSGYLLDNRGVGKNSAFINITYLEYSKQTAVLSLAEMMKLVIDKDPFTEMYNCGNRYQYKDILNDLNKAIDSGQLNKFKRIL